MKRCILVIDDNPEILTKTCNAWARRGYVQRCAKTSEEAAGELLAAQKAGRDMRLIALVADHLDMRLIPAVKLMRRMSALPLLILTSEYHAQIRNEAFILGADRYLTIPSTIDEGIISGLALIRISERFTGVCQDSTAILLPHDFYISMEQRRVFLKNREIRLTRKEFDLLWYFAINRNITLSYEKIYERVWGDEYNENTNRMIWSMVNRLRQKFSAVAGIPNFIQSERYTGYRFSVNADALRIAE